MRCFNTAGPCEPRFHYMLPAAERLPEAPRLVAQGACFVVHAPRQTGKTTTLRALAQALTAQGRYAALHVTCEIGEIGEDDYQAVQRTLLRTIQREATAMLPAELQPLSGGQPWLVNALAREIIDEMGIAPPTPLTAAHIEEAKEHLILARATHLDSLVARLGEDRVRRIIEPLLAGESPAGGVTYASTARC
jgi:hypothetical protein